MLLPETELESQLNHHLDPEMTSMVSDNLLWNIEVRNDLVEKKQGCCFTIIHDSGHSFSPLSKVVHCYNNILMTLSQRRVTSCKINAPLCERTDGNNKKERS